MVVFTAPHPFYGGRDPGFFPLGAPCMENERGGVNPGVFRYLQYSWIYRFLGD